MSFLFFVLTVLTLNIFPVLGTQSSESEKNGNINLSNRILLVFVALSCHIPFRCITPFILVLHFILALLLHSIRLQ